MSERLFEFEVVVVGAGPAGLAAACTAAEAGKRVGLVDETPWLGGQIWRGQQARASAPQARAWFERFRRCGARLLDSTSVIAAPRKGCLLAEHPSGPREIHWEKLVLATGARELFLPLPGWTLPGVLGPGGLQALAKNGWPVAGKRVAVCGTGPLLLAVADGLAKLGAQIVSISEQAPLAGVMKFGFSLVKHPQKLVQGIGMRTRLLGVPYRFGVWPIRADGDGAVRSVTLTNGNVAWTEECDLLACGFNLVPNVELAMAMGCLLAGEFVRVDDLQAASLKDVYAAGEVTGIGGADCGLVEGQIAGYAASGQQVKAEALLVERRSWHEFRAALAAAFALRPELKVLAADDTLLCRCEDVALGQVRQFRGWREAKILSRCGMGPCQGRVCGSAAKFVLGWGMESVRPPVLPARVESLITSAKEN
jgi:NADPH-dependent 2,4-dienoyl-CoA reductase/sulfur reductase-like enzyme